MALSIDYGCCRLRHFLDYAYRDVQNLINMIRKPQQPASKESIERQEQAVRDVVQYCQNDSDCRRVQILQYFGEKFEKKDCGRRCNNCRNDEVLVPRDVTTQAKEVINLVRSLQEAKENVTVAHCREIFRGAKTASVRDKGHDRHSLYGAGKDMPKELMEQLFSRLLYLDAFQEYSAPNNSGYHNQYVKASVSILPFYLSLLTFFHKLGARANDFLNGKRTLELSFRPKQPKISSKAVKTPKSTESGGRKTAKGKQPAGVVRMEDPIELYQDDSETEDESNEDVDVFEIEPSQIQPTLPPPPPQQARKRVKSDPSYVDVLSDNDGDTEEDSNTALFNRLVSYRQRVSEALSSVELANLPFQLLDKNKSLNASDIYSDEELQYIR